MYFIYLLKHEKTGELYYGYTNNVERRSEEHGREWMLIYYEAYLTESDARKREEKLKHYGQSRTHLKNRLKSSL